MPLTHLILCVFLMSAAVASHAACPPTRPKLPPEKALENLRAAEAAHEAAKKDWLQAMKKAMDAEGEAIRAEHAARVAGKPPPPRPPHVGQAEKDMHEAGKRLDDAKKALKDARNDFRRSGPGGSGFPPPNRPPSGGGNSPGGSGGGGGGGPSGSGGADPTKTQPDLGDTLRGEPPGPIYAPVRHGPQFPAGSRVPPSKMAAGTAGVVDSFKPSK